MKIWEIRLQNGIFVYKAGISFTKWVFHLQRETLGLQTGLSLYISPFEILSTIFYLFHNPIIKPEFYIVNFVFYFSRSCLQSKLLVN